MTDPIRILCCSDLHFGIHTINQEEMAEAFIKTVFPLLTETDILFINGDFFDTLVVFDTLSFDPIYTLILQLFALCERHQIALRILQGTFTHDRNQCRRFEVIYKNTGYHFDFALMMTISLDEIHVRDRTLKVLYVPDDLPSVKTSDDVMVMIHEAMHHKGWDTVDYACMHGFFDFTFPKGVSQDNVVVFREAQFDFVRKMIDVGHVHQHRVQGKVISNGSFDRLCTGDEAPKGMIRILDYPEYYTAIFIENVYAAVFDTLVISRDDTTETIRLKILDHLESLKTNRTIYLRFIVDQPDLREAIKTWFRLHRPDVKLGFKRSGEADAMPFIIASDALFVPSQDRIVPTRQTIGSYVRSHIPDHYPLTLDAIHAYLESPV